MAVAVLGTASIASAQLYVETFQGTTPTSIVGQDAGNIGWAASGNYGWIGYYDSRAAGSLINSATLTSVNAGGAFMGNGSGNLMMALYTTDSMGPGAYGESSFSDISLSANPTLNFSVLLQNEQGWNDGAIPPISGWILVQNNGSWYASATGLTAPTSLDPGGWPTWNSSIFGNFDPTSLTLTGAKADWVTVSGIGTGTITLGSIPANDLTGDITGVGLLENAVTSGEGGSWNYSDLEIMSVPEPSTIGLCLLGGLALVGLRRRA